MLIQVSKGIWDSLDEDVRKTYIENIVSDHINIVKYYDLYANGTAEGIANTVYDIVVDNERLLEKYQDNYKPCKGYGKARKVVDNVFVVPVCWEFMEDSHTYKFIITITLEDI